MARSVYFSQGRQSEAELYENLVVEGLSIYGHDVYYIPRTMASRDLILNEDIESKFSDAYIIEMYLENVDGFDGDGTLFTKFGLQIRDQATFVVSRKRWEKLIGAFNNEIVDGRPNEGDLIYLPLTRSFFEIKFVEHKSPFYQLDKLPVYKLQCELFEYSNEDISTGIDEIDNIQSQFATSYCFAVGSSNSIMFEIGETVKQVLSPATTTTTAVEISAKVLKLEHETAGDPNSRLLIFLGEIRSNTGEFSAFTVGSSNALKLIGLTSGAQWSILTKFDIDTASADKTFTSGEGAQNYAFEKDAGDIIDFTESNPFGEIGFSTTVVPFTILSYRADSSGISADSALFTADTF